MDGIDTSVYNQVTPSTHHSNIAQLKQCFTTNFNELQLLVSKSQNYDSLNAANTHFKAAISVIKAMESSNTVVCTNKKRFLPPNSNHDKQYFSTKKRRCTSSQSIYKPSADEKTKQRSIFKREEPKFVVYASKRMILQTL